MDEYYQMVQSLPSWLARQLMDMPSALAPDVQELRLRVGCAPAFTMRGAVCTPQETARELASLQRMLLTPQQMEEILFTLCGGSVHTHQTEIAQGYVTGPSGCRAGLGGRFLQNPEQGVVLQELTSVNLRVAREKTIPLPQELCAAMQTHFIGMLLVGEPGSGKTTLVSLIPRFYDATKGQVTLLGQPITAYSKAELNRHVAVVMQKAQLFKGTIRSNLLWGNENATDEELWHALSIAQSEDFVRQKPGKLDDPVEQGGRNLSGGQRQRLTIARALVGHPDILILDDSASALDYATDAALRKALRTLPAETTLFIVSQRTSSLRHADQIIVLDDGHVVGIGKHDTLMQTCEVYREIHESQFRKGSDVQ